MSSISASIHATLPTRILPSTVLADSSDYQDGFAGIPHINMESIRQANIQADMQRRTSPLASQKGKGRAEDAYYPVSYIRGEWMEGLFSKGVGKKRVKHLLSDEVLCLGTSEASVTSEFSRPLIYLEAYKHGCPPASAQIYMTQSQVNWIVDEVYSRTAGTGEKIRFEDVDVDKEKAVKLQDFEATRKVSFKSDVARFRLRCGLPVTTPAMQKKKKPQPEVAKPAATAQAFSSLTAPPPVPQSTSSPSEPIVTPIAFGPPQPPHLPAPKPTSYASLSKAERAARLRAAREEALQHHILAQKAALPHAKQFYKNIERLGGAALACDVESWTEDADVLLELGLAWFIWSEGEDGMMQRDGESRHYIIKETLQYNNEEIEAKREDYSLGTSEVLPQVEVSACLKDKIAELSGYGPLVLVFHDASAETRYFQKLGVDPTAYLTSIPAAYSSLTIQAWPILPSAFDAVIPTMPILISDTQNLYCGWSEPPIKQINLGKACKALGLDVEIEKLHNAGNDAFATLRMWELLLDPGAGRQDRLMKQQRQGSDLDVWAAASRDVPSLEESHSAKREHKTRTDEPTDASSASFVQEEITAQDDNLVAAMMRHCAVGNLIDL